MKARAQTAATSIETPGAEEDISDSNAVLAHVASQEQMVIDRLRQTGGEIAVQELKEKFNVVDSPPKTETKQETTNKEELEVEVPVEVPEEPLPEEGHVSHDEVSEQEEEEKPGPSSEFYEDMAKMEMAHEIVMNSNYKIEKKQSEGLQGQVESTMKEAFWDSVKQEVENGDYSQCVNLLAEIREQIESIGTIEKLPPTHPFRVLIADTIDIPLIKQQIEHQTFDLSIKVKGIVSILVKLCSAAKDPEIRGIVELTDVVEIFKALFEAVQAIKLEIANYYLEKAKSTIKQHSIEYERAKFEEFLQNHPSGLDKTKEWLRENEKDSPLATMCQAYLHLLSVEPPKPETIALDEARYRKLGSQLRSILLSSLLSLKLGSLHPGYAEIPFLSSLHSTLQILAPDDPAPYRDLILHKTVDLCVTKVPTINKTTLEKVVSSAVDAVTQESEQDPVLQILRRRLSGYLTEVSLNRKPGVPKGFELVQEQVVQCGEAFLKLVDFNRRVYGPYYAKILKQTSSG